MNGNWQKLIISIPHGPDWKTDWNALWETPLRPYISGMRGTLQNPFWHGEGDVWTHTKMVCDEMAADREFRELEEEKRQCLFLAAILHDIGKIPCTHLEDGTWVSPGHTVVGAKMARELLRQHQSFIWNATNISLMTRRKQLDLFEQYNALVRIVFLETGWETGLERNGSRQREVPRKAIEKMLGNLELPERWEAREVEWICT